ncbi:protein Wnt-3a [Callorhinus ursinus]|uniref:Protein Wnt n=1 Tax=Callorhinus ursinus TaxID=34884 RepID=A0A3Q7N3U9_CALUR|nr:protein Wnt-3a [Callorhinus ursinus]
MAPLSYSVPPVPGRVCSAQAPLATWLWDTSSSLEEVKEDRALGPERVGGEPGQGWWSLEQLGQHLGWHPGLAPRLQEVASRGLPRRRAGQVEVLGVGRAGADSAPRNRAAASTKHPLQPPICSSPRLMPLSTGAGLSVLRDPSASEASRFTEWRRQSGRGSLTCSDQLIQLTVLHKLGQSLAVGPQYSSLGTQPILCASIPGLVPKQLRFCRNYVEIMPSVAEGVKISIQECQHQFRGRRWNCTTVNNSLAIFGPVLDKATRESAFVHAIASAGVAFAVTRSCAEGSAAICGCSSRHQGSPGEGWKWGGCSEDIEFGGMVSREFADARENRPDARSAMNRHNNEAGRQAIASHMHLKCKCHGLSGSCEVKTCWWSQPDFRAIGDLLKDKYDSASEMVVEKHRESRGWVETLRPRYTYFKVPTERDLVYYEASPNFCEPNAETGSFGTRDRTCNVSSHGIDGCDLLCCGRGHNARTERRREKCHCVFHWCCYVSCQECARVYDVHTCK